MRTLIRNVKVYDGLGSFPFISDILIEKRAHIKDCSENRRKSR